LLRGGGYSVCGGASVATRNGGTNPASYSASIATLGGTLSLTVDLGTTGHDLAWPVAFDSPATIALPGGQVLLCADGSGSGELLGLPPAAGPLATFDSAVPNDPTLCGARIYSQALHLGGVAPFALSNAQDLVIAAF
jgi:hypothetical protein